MSSSQSPSTSLTRILSRLSPKILSTDPHSPLRHSPFERTKTAANLEYARTLLLRAEHEAASIKTQQRKHTAQAALLKHRSLIKKLNDRLFELGQLDDGRWSEEEAEDGNIDEVLRGVLEEDNIAPSAPTSPRNGKMGDTQELKGGRAMVEERRDLFAGRDATATSSGLRARGGKDGSVGMDTGVSTGRVASGSDSMEKNTTTALESADTLHADLTSSLVGLATQLKLSAQAFSDDLALDTQQLGSTEEALGKNKSGLDAATQRMGVLRRMSEGRWWWGRMVLYAGIGALWVVLILLVFVGPKIRF